RHDQHDDGCQSPRQWNCSRRDGGNRPQIRVGQAGRPVDDTASRAGRKGLVRKSLTASPPRRRLALFTSASGVHSGEVETFSPWSCAGLTPPTGQARQRRRRGVMRPHIQQAAPKFAASAAGLTRLAQNQVDRKFLQMNAQTIYLATIWIIPVLVA